MSFGALAIFTLLTIVGLNLLEIPSFAIANPDSAINQTSHAHELIAQSPVPHDAQPTAISAPSISTSDTALLFQNDRYAVRVFKEGEQAYINIYDKTKQVQPLQKVPVSITRAGNPKKDPTKYVATIVDQQYIVTISPLGASDLTIFKGGRIAYQQGSNQVEVARKISGISEQAEPINPTRELVRKIFVNYAKLTLFALMFSMGLHWTFRDVVWLWQQPSLLVRSLFSVLIAVPILGVLVVFIPGLTVAQRIGIGAMFTCPGAPMIPVKSLKAGGHPQFIGSLQFTISLLAIITVPVTALILAQFFPNQAWLSPQEIANQIFFAQILPMGLGVLLAQYVPKLADELLEPANKIASLLLLLVAIVLLVVTLDDVLNAGVAAYLAIGLLSLASLVCGHLLGGPDPGTRTALAYATSTRNAGLAILLVTLNFPNLDYVKGGIINTLITYALVTAIVTIPYTIWRKRSLVVEALGMIVNESNL
ncbi:bile acid:sodium symporter family protein [Pantanalinema sp. GBBB05]|uniref:bile acid:sodium symporter family protein n=1 Tax=Pantanalinema sp. GBBB05 TaxID=2604139 RepID=UPI003D8155FA